MVNLGGASFTLPGVSVCEAQAAVYEPFYAVDIGDLATDSGLANTSRGEAMDVNDDGFAVGWYEDATDSNNEKPFFMTPVDGGSASPLGLGSFSVGHAIAMSETTSYNLAGAIIVGWVDSSIGHQAAYWTWDGISQWVFNLVLNGSATVSEAQAVTKSGIVSGFFLDPSAQNEERVFIYYPSTGTISFPSGTRAEALAARDDATVPVIAGLFVTQQLKMHGFYLNNGISQDLHSILVSAFPNNGYTDSVALGMSDNGDGSEDIVGYGSFTPQGGGTGTDAVYWWRNSGQSWQVGLLNIPNPDPVDARGAAITDRALDGSVDLAGDYVPSNSLGGAFYVTMRQNGAGSVDYWSYKLDRTVTVNAHPSLVMFPLAVRQSGKTGHTWTGNGINNSSAIAGSYKPDETLGAYRPCLFVPNDFDNNGIPDIREILQSRLAGGDDDTNNNWLLDSVEQMRVGLFSPGGSVAAKTIASVQVVRLMGFDQQILEDILTDTGQGGVCSAKANAINNWGGNGNPALPPKEIILNTRTVDPSSGPDYNFDFLLNSTTGITAKKNLDDIRTFAFRFARCIDGMQFGNEMFTGPGQYFFHAGDLPSYPNYEGSIRDIRDASTLDEAVNLVFAQIGGQGEAARIGSALAGRPLRIFSPAVSLGMTKPGYCGTVMQGGALGPGKDFSATAVTDLVNFANANRLIFDQHLNYTSLSGLQETVDKITGAFTGSDVNCPGKTTAPWGSGPDMIASLENGPIPTDTWWTANNLEAKAYYDPGHDCSGVGDKTWDQFVSDWFVNEFGGNFQLPDVFTAVSGANFRYLCVNTTQEDIKNTGLLSRTIMGALIADKIDPGCVSDPNGFMPIKGDYEFAAAGGFQVDPFNPHPNPCNGSMTCPQ